MAVKIKGFVSLHESPTAVTRAIQILSGYGSVLEASLSLEESDGKLTAGAVIDGEWVEVDLDAEAFSDLWGWQDRDVKWHFCQKCNRWYRPLTAKALDKFLDYRDCCWPCHIGHNLAAIDPPHRGDFEYRQEKTQ